MIKIISTDIIESSIKHIGVKGKVKFKASVLESFIFGRENDII